MALIKHREGVCGRKATPEETELLQAFAKEWVEVIEPANKTRAAEIVNRFHDLYIQLGRVPTTSEIFS